MKNEVRKTLDNKLKRETQVTRQSATLSSATTKYAMFRKLSGQCGVSMLYVEYSGNKSRIGKVNVVYRAALSTKAGKLKSSHL